MFYSYDSDTFSQLNDFDSAKGLLAQNREKISELGSIIVRHSLHNQLGISLLHKHFELQNSERLVAEFHESSIVTEPKIPQLNEDLIPYLWKLRISKEDESLRFYPLEFVRSSEKTLAAAKSYSSVLTHPEFLLEMGEALDRLDINNVFGISTLDRTNLIVDEDEILVERSDNLIRQSLLSIESIDDCTPSKLTETLWTFSPSFEVGQGCLHCTVCCIVHCYSHHPHKS